MTRIKVYGPVALIIDTDRGSMIHPSDLPLPNRFVCAALKAARAAGLVEAVEFAHVDGCDVTYFVSDYEHGKAPNG